MFRPSERTGPLRPHEAIRERMLDQNGLVGPVPKPATLPRGNRKYKVLLCAADFGVIVIAILVGYWFYPVLGSNVSRPTGYAAAFAIPFICIGTLARYGLYSARLVTTRLDEIGRLLNAWIACVLMVAALCFMAKLEVSRGLAATSAIYAFIGLVFEREAARQIFARLRSQGKLGRSVVLVGANNEGIALCNSIVQNPWLGYVVAGFVDDSAPIGSEPCAGFKVIGRVDDLGEITSDRAISTALLVSTASDADRTNELAKHLMDLGIHVEMTTGLRDVAPERLKVRRLGRFPVMYLEPVPTSGWRPIAKRTLDIVGASALDSCHVTAADSRSYCNKTRQQGTCAVSATTLRTRRQANWGLQASDDDRRRRANASGAGSAK